MPTDNASESTVVAVGPHTFDPWHPKWFMPRCKVCREFEEHELHYTSSSSPDFCPDPWCDGPTGHVACVAERFACALREMFPPLDRENHDG